MGNHAEAVSQFSALANTILLHSHRITGMGDSIHKSDFPPSAIKMSFMIAAPSG